MRVVYHSRHAMHSISRRGKKPIVFNPGKDGRGEFTTSDSEVQQFIEGHPAFITGAVTRESAPKPPAEAKSGLNFFQRLWLKW